MTYPPQQPGPYGPQPDPYGQQHPQQQPGWTGGFPQQQPYGQQQQQQQPYGYGGYPGMPPQNNNSKKGLVIGLAVGGVLLVGGAVTTILLLTGGDDEPTASGNGTTSAPAGSGNGGDTGSPEAVVERVIKAVDDKDAEAAHATLCDPDSKSPAFELNEAPATLKLQTSLSGQITETGSTAKARLSIKATEGGSTRSRTITMQLSLKKDAGKWCVSSVSMNSGTGSSSSPSRTTSTRPTF